MCSAGHTCCGRTPETKNEPDSITCNPPTQQCPLNRMSAHDYIGAGHIYIYTPGGGGGALAGGGGGGGGGSPVGAIAGGAVGLVLVLAAVVLVCRKRAKRIKMIKALKLKEVSFEMGTARAQVSDVTPKNLTMSDGI